MPMDQKYTGNHIIGQVALMQKASMQKRWLGKNPKDEEKLV